MTAIATQRSTSRTDELPTAALLYTWLYLVWQVMFYNWEVTRSGVPGEWNTPVAHVLLAICLIVGAAWPLVVSASMVRDYFAFANHHWRPDWRLFMVPLAFSIATVTQLASAIQ